ncbi:probable basic-leucine zipper transcription factor E [Eurytemora carolleeae]|uniref:probable basic-leucine zipper transcription factor E n=1 Tax=Eurytemora carolleeae TaxID=1294199 RepID=UPI000C78DF45|nr:probable basic-leucine zipper transcription factor E [Eurytemora carolleeae]|eukprot:XP_023346367.1 probable basic-leucine zipper transcription factor E [Eurytemora affinis]
MALSLPNQHIQNYCTLDQVRLKEKNVLVIGNEGEGIPYPLLQIVDQGLFIKSGKGVAQDDYVDSLNVSVATGITLQALFNNNSNNINNKNNDDNNDNSANNIR